MIGRMQPTRRDDPSPPPAPSRRAAVLYGLAAAALYGVAMPAVKPMLAARGASLTAGMLYLGMGGALLATFLVRGAPAPRLSRGDAGWLCVSVVLGGIVAPTLLLWGLARTPATVTALLSNAEVVFTTLIAHFLLHERYGRRLAAGLALVVTGTAVIGGAGARGADLLPSLAILAACLAWAVDNNATRRIAHADASFVGLAKGLVAGTFNTLVATAAGATSVAPRALLWTVLVGAVSYGVSFALYMRALRGLGAARTAAYFATAPFAGAVVAVLALGEPITTRLVLAALAMAGGVWLHVTEPHAPRAGTG